ncbi:YetF domain-containing protein [Paenibacillus macerans]|uniref:YetF domain-containing protein n=1 Tax=Paenibacillus macerans TaxID=44252 RepID=UPI003530CB48
MELVRRLAQRPFHHHDRKRTSGAEQHAQAAHKRDQLEVRLRQIGVSNIADVKTATLEPNGQIGYELTESARPVTVGDLERIFGLKPGMSLDQSIIPPQSIPNCNKGIPMYGQFMNSA